MNKNEFANEIKGFRSQLIILKKIIEKHSRKQIFTKSILKQLQDIATLWFDKFESPLRHFYNLDREIIDHYHELIGKLLELSTINPATSTVLGLLRDIEKDINQSLLVPVLKYQKEISKNGDYANILLGKKGVEQEYLKEAVECAEEGHFRAAIILGWAAAVDRIQQVIMKNGLEKFNNASVRMSAISTGRYKRFKKKFNIQNLSDLRMTVFDNDLLWILEFLGLIGGNEHEKLEICFTMRNTCAHPGEAKFSPENVASFFSDLNTLIFNNPKFFLT